MVMLPAAVIALYLWIRAADQYASDLGFSVRREESSSAIELLGGLTTLSGSSSSDTDILYEFLQSQEIVRTLDEQLDLRAIWAKAGPRVDPIFSYHPPGTIEDLMDHWESKVLISYDGASGLIDLRVLTFTPEDSQTIAEAILRESGEMINELSALARFDTIRYAQEELERSVERLKQARQSVTSFRNRNQIVDPTIDTEGQMGLVNTLQQQLVEALIELDLLRETSRESDPRIEQAERRIRVIENRISAERDKLGFGAGAGNREAFANLVGEYEGLIVDREFAEETYTSALAAFDAARADADRQSRYLAAHVTPTLAEKAEYPKRDVIMGVSVMFLFLSWSVLMLVAYSLRDRR